MTSSLFKKCLAEFLGAFLIVFVGCGTAIANQLSGGIITHFGVATAFGLVVLVLVYAFGHISGAHANCSVSIAFALTRHFSVKQLVPYLISQILGATAASVAHYFAFKGPFAAILPGVQMTYGGTFPVDGSFMTAFVWEFILTFILMFVVMSMATDYRAVKTAAGIVIGSIVWVEALFAGPICGASMNPARSIGPAIVSGNYEHLLAYIIGPITGAIAGAFTYKYIATAKDDAALKSG